VVDLKKFVLPLLRGDLIMEAELDFDDRSERIMVERDPVFVSSSMEM
jgi:hypothetical protein